MLNEHTKTKNFKEKGEKIMNLITKLLNKKIGNYTIAKYAVTRLSGILMAGPTLGTIAGTIAGVCYGAQEKDILKEFSQTEYYQSQTIADDTTLSNLETLLNEEKIKLEVANQQLQNGEITSHEYAVVYEKYSIVKDDYDEMYATCTSSSRPKTIIQKYIESVEAGEIVETSESTEKIVAEYKQALDSANTASWTCIGLICSAIPAFIAGYEIGSYYPYYIA